MVKPADSEGTCGVCERHHKVRDQKVVLHGYQRPGDGYITGRCFGEAMLAWEISAEPAGRFLAEVLRPSLASTEVRLAEFYGGLVTSLPREKRPLTAKPEYESITPGHGDWPAVFKHEQAKVFARYQHYQGLVARFEARIAAWQPAQLAPVAREPRYMRVVFVEAYGWWCATSLKSNRLIARGRNLEYLMKATSDKGWSLPPGTEAPVEVRAIDLFRKSAALPDPENRRVQVRDVRAAPIVAKMVVAAYAGLTVDQQRQIDGRCCQDIVYDVARVEYFADALTVEKVKVALVGSFVHRTGF